MIQNFKQMVHHFQIPTNIDYKKLARFFIAVVLLFSLHPGKSPKNLPDHSDSFHTRFYCPPCGCKDDQKILSTGGNCDACTMELIQKQQGLTGQTASLLSGFFRQTSLTNVYYNRIMYPAFFAGILLSIFILMQLKRNRANLFLGIMTFTFSLYPFQNRMKCLSHALTDSEALVFLPISFIVAIGPSLYFYTKMNISPKERFSKKDYLHFVPVILVFIMYMFLFLKSDLEKNAIYLSPGIIAFSHYEQLAAIVLTTIYIYFSIKIMKEHQINLNGDSLIRAEKVYWLSRLIFILSVLFTGWLGILLVNRIFFNFGISHLTYYPLWAAVSLFLYWIGFYCLFRPKLIFANSMTKTNGYSNGLAEVQINYYTNALLEIMDTEKPYLDPSLDLNKLAKLMKIKPKHLTIVLNYGLKKKFYDFLNEYRVKEAKQALCDPKNEHFTILAIAYESGFNSKSSFNALFKKHVKMTPKAFKNKNQLTPSAK